MCCCFQERYGLYILKPNRVAFEYIHEAPTKSNYFGNEVDPAFIVL